jgi:hypothetical protein
MVPSSIACEAPRNQSRVSAAPRADDIEQDDHPALHEDAGADTARDLVLG